MLFASPDLWICIGSIEGFVGHSSPRYSLTVKFDLFFGFALDLGCTLVCDFGAFFSSDELYYKSDVIKCKDGSKKFSKDQLNDEFCDCPDGTDEPG